MSSWHTTARAVSAVLQGYVYNCQGLTSLCVQARGLGPWSSAMQLVEARAEALAAREAKRLEQSAEQAELLKQAVKWTPTRDPAAGKRPQQRVPPLVNMCVELMVEYIEDVESLVGLPDIIKVIKPWLHGCTSGLVPHQSVCCHCLAPSLEHDTVGAGAILYGVQSHRCSCADQAATALSWSS